MGLIENLIQREPGAPGAASTSDVRERRALDDLLAHLAPELPRDGQVQLLSRSLRSQAGTPSRPVTTFRVEVLLPHHRGDAAAFLTVLRADLEPVADRAPGAAGRPYLRSVPLPATEGARAASFDVAHTSLRLPLGRYQLLALLGVVTDDGQARLVERLPLVADLLEDQRGDAADEVEDPRLLAGRETLSLVVGLSLFVAFADGEFDASEEAALVRVLVDIEDPPPERRQALAESLRRVSGGFRYKKEILDGLCTRARQTLGFDERRMLVKVLLRVGTADGELHPNEEKLLRYVTAQIGLPDAEITRPIDDFFAV